MNLIFMRHGEATDNVKGLISDKEIYWSVLTECGKKTVEKSLNKLPDNINKMYVSPFPRTVQTAHYVYKKHPDIDVIIDNRLREIYHGKYSHQKNDDKLDNIRKMQIDGDYFIKFGETGENRFEIESRLSEFLVDVYNNNTKNSNILIVSHGSIISYIKRMLGLNLSHIKKGQIEMFDNVNFDILFQYMKKLKYTKK